jgi:hypothetical protein
VLFIVGLWECIRKVQCAHEPARRRLKEGRRQRNHPNTTNRQGIVIPTMSKRSAVTLLRRAAWTVPRVEGDSFTSCRPLRPLTCSLSSLLRPRPSAAVTSDLSRRPGIEAFRTYSQKPNNKIYNFEDVRCLPWHVYLQGQRVADNASPVADAEINHGSQSRHSHRRYIQCPSSSSLASLLSMAIYGPFSTSTDEWQIPVSHPNCRSQAGYRERSTYLSSPLRTVFISVRRSLKIATGSSGLTATLKLSSTAVLACVVKQQQGWQGMLDGPRLLSTPAAGWTGVAKAGRWRGDMYVRQRLDRRLRGRLRLARLSERV